MKIAFEKVQPISKPFMVAIDGVTMQGSLQKVNHNLVKLDANIDGEVAVHCDRCGVVYNLNINQPLSLELSQVAMQNKDNLDIIEFLNGEIDLDYILQSEIDSLTSLYHYCEKCEGIEDFEVEI